MTSISDVIAKNYYEGLNAKQTEEEKLKELKKSLKEFKGILDSGWDRSDIDRAILVVNRELNKRKWSDKYDR